MRTVIAIILATATALCVAGVELTEDAPVVRPPVAGDVGGAVSPAEAVKQLSAVSRVTGKTFRPESFDRRTGRFLFKALPGDARYDLVVAAADGRSIEGIDLDFVDARMLRLAELRRKELNLPPEEARALARDDAGEIIKSVREMNDFMEIRRPLYLRGHGRRATMLVELMRTREFHASGGSLIWRVELWYFENNFGGWERVPNTERLLRRERIPRGEWEKIHVEYYPQLSVYVGPDGAAAPVEFRIPDKPDATRGRPAKTAPALKTDPHIDGLDEKADANAGNVQEKPPGPLSPDRPSPDRRSPDRKGGGSAPTD